MFCFLMIDRRRINDVLEEGESDSSSSSNSSYTWVIVDNDGNPIKWTKLSEHTYAARIGLDYSQR